MKKHHVVYICIHIPTSRYWLGLILCFIITGLCLYTSQGICESRTTSTVMWTRVLHKNSMCERHLLKKMDNREPCWDSNTHKRAYIYLYFFKKLVKTTHRKKNYIEEKLPARSSHFGEHTRYFLTNAAAPLTDTHLFSYSKLYKYLNKTSKYSCLLEI